MRKQSKQKTRKEVPDVPKHGRIKFYTDKVVVIEKTTDPSKISTDDKVRKETGESIDKTIIDRIMIHYSNNPKKLSIQFAATEMRDRAISSWKGDYMFGTSNMRKINKEKKATAGVAKGVPLYMNDENLHSDTTNKYSGISPQHMKSGSNKQNLRAHKIFFENAA